MANEKTDDDRDTARGWARRNLVALVAEVRAFVAWADAAKALPNDPSTDTGNGEVTEWEHALPARVERLRAALAPLEEAAGAARAVEAYAVGVRRSVLMKAPEVDESQADDPPRFMDAAGHLPPEVQVEMRFWLLKALALVAATRTAPTVKGVVDITPWLPVEAAMNERYEWTLRVMLVCHPVLGSFVLVSVKFHGPLSYQMGAVSALATFVRGGEG